MGANPYLLDWWMLPKPAGFIIVYTYWMDERCLNLHQTFTCWIYNSLYLMGGWMLPKSSPPGFILIYTGLWHTILNCIIPMREFKRENYLVTSFIQRLFYVMTNRFESTSYAKVTSASLATLALESRSTLISASSTTLTSASTEWTTT